LNRGVKGLGASRARRVARPFSRPYLAFYFSSRRRTGGSSTVAKGSLINAKIFAGHCWPPLSTSCRGRTISYALSSNSPIKKISIVNPARRRDRRRGDISRD